MASKPRADLIGLAWPFAAGELLEAGMLVTSIAILRDHSSQAAFSLATGVLTLIRLASFGFVAGLFVESTLSEGAGDSRATGAALGVASLLAIGVGLVAFFGRHLLVLAATHWTSSADTSATTVRLVTLLALGIMPELLGFGFGTALRTQGDGISYLVATTVGFVAFQVVAWSGTDRVVGVAVGRVMRQVVVMTVLAWRCRRNIMGVHWESRYLRLSLRHALPMALQWLSESGGFSVLVFWVEATGGSSQSAAFTVTTNLMWMGYIPCRAAAAASSIVAGRYLGARDVSKYFRQFRLTLALSLGTFLPVATLMLAAAPWLTRFMSNSDEVGALVQSALWLACAGHLVDIFALSLRTSLQSAGDAAYASTAAALTRQLFAGGAAVFLRPSVPGFWVWGVLAAESLAAAAILARRYTSTDFRQFIHARFGEK